MELKFNLNDKVFKLDNNKLNLIFNYFHKKSNFQKQLLIKNIVSVTENRCTFFNDIDFTRFVSGSDSFKVFDQNGKNCSGDRIFNLNSAEDIKELKNIIEKHCQENELEAQKEDQRLIEEKLKKIEQLEKEIKDIKERKRKYFGTPIVIKDFFENTKQELFELIDKETTF